MALNPELERIVLQKMASHLNATDHGFGVLSDGEEDLAVALIESMGKLMVDKEFKVRMHLHNLIGYGYDFDKRSDNGGSSREIYKRAVENTKMLGGTPHTETLISSGVENDRFGWYLTALKF